MTCQGVGVPCQGVGVTCHVLLAAVVPGFLARAQGSPVHLVAGAGVVAGDGTGAAY